MIAFEIVIFFLKSIHKISLNSISRFNEKREKVNNI